jgi:hypothetical protein
MLTWEAEAVGSQVPGHPGLHSEILTHKKTKEIIAEGII